MYKTKRSLAAVIMLMLMLLMMSGCGAGKAENAGAASDTSPTAAEESTEGTDAASDQASAAAEENKKDADAGSAAAEENADDGKDPAMKMTINDTEVELSWENNDSVTALAEMAENGPVTIGMEPYGGFEQVGPIGATLPSSDTDIKTEAGDIMLYTGRQMVIFCGSNSWAYTRLGKITDKSAAELEDLLGGSGVTVSITAEQ